MWFFEDDDDDEDTYQNNTNNSVLGRSISNHRPTNNYSATPHSTRSRDDDVWVPMGLVNQGATCYLNALLQIFHNIRALRELFYTIPLGADENDPYIRAAAWQFRKLFALLDVGVQSHCDTAEFTRESFQWEAKDGLIQHDAHELVTKLVDLLRTQLRDIKVGDDSVERRLSHMFEGSSVENSVKCVNCGAATGREEPFLTLNCQVKGCASLKESLSLLFLQTETLDGDNKYECETCKQVTAKELSGKLCKLPDVLVLNLRRFEYNTETWQRYKVTDHFEFPLEVDMAPYLKEKPTAATTPDEQHQQSSPAATPQQSSAIASPQPSPTATSPQSHLYQLHGVVVHAGSGYSGHYTSISKLSCALGQDDWYLYDDSRVTKVDPQQALQDTFKGRSSAYMLFYQRVDDGPARVASWPLPPVQVRTPCLSANAKLIADWAAYRWDQHKLCVELLTETGVAPPGESISAFARPGTDVASNNRQVGVRLDQDTPLVQFSSESNWGELQLKASCVEVDGRQPLADLMHALGQAGLTVCPVRQMTYAADNAPRFFFDVPLTPTQLETPLRDIEQLEFSDVHHHDADGSKGEEHPCITLLLAAGSVAETTVTSRGCSGQPIWVDCELLRVDAASTAVSLVVDPSASLSHISNLVTKRLEQETGSLALYLACADPSLLVSLVDVQAPCSVDDALLDVLLKLECVSDLDVGRDGFFSSYRLTVLAHRVDQGENLSERRFRERMARFEFPVDVLRVREKDFELLQQAAECMDSVDLTEHGTTGNRFSFPTVRMEVGIGAIQCTMSDTVEHVKQLVLENVVKGSSSCSEDLVLCVEVGGAMLYPIYDSSIVDASVEQSQQLHCLGAIRSVLRDEECCSPLRLVVVNSKESMALNVTVAFRHCEFSTKISLSPEDTVTDLKKQALVQLQGVSGLQSVGGERSEKALRHLEEMRAISDRHGFWMFRFRNMDWQGSPRDLVEEHISVKQGNGSPAVEVVRERANAIVASRTPGQVLRELCNKGEVIDGERIYSRLSGYVPHGRDLVDVFGTMSEDDLDQRLGGGFFDEIHLNPTVEGVCFAENRLSDVDARDMTNGFMLEVGVPTLPQEVLNELVVWVPGAGGGDGGDGGGHGGDCGGGRSDDRCGGDDKDANEKAGGTSPDDAPVTSDTNANEKAGGTSPDDAPVTSDTNTNTKENALDDASRVTSRDGTTNAPQRKPLNIKANPLDRDSERRRRTLTRLFDTQLATFSWMSVYDVVQATILCAFVHHVKRSHWEANASDAKSATKRWILDVLRHIAAGGSWRIALSKLPIRLPGRVLWEGHVANTSPVDRQSVNVRKNAKLPIGLPFVWEILPQVPAGSPFLGPARCTYLVNRVHTPVKTTIRLWVQVVRQGEAEVRWPPRELWINGATDPDDLVGMISTMFDKSLEWTSPDDVLLARHDMGTHKWVCLSRNVPKESLAAWKTAKQLMLGRPPWRLNDGEFVAGLVNETIPEDTLRDIQQSKTFDKFVYDTDADEYARNLASRRYKRSNKKRSSPATSGVSSRLAKMDEVELNLGGGHFGGHGT